MCVGRKIECVCVRVREKERDIGERYPQVRENELKRLWVDQEVGGVDIMKGGGAGAGGDDHPPQANNLDCICLFRFQLCMLSHFETEELTDEFELRSSRMFSTSVVSFNHNFIDDYVRW